MQLQPGDALILDSRLLRRWARVPLENMDSSDSSDANELLVEEAGFAPWWVDSGVLGSASAPARVLLAQQGVTRLPEPARLLGITGDDKKQSILQNDLTSHWIFEEQPAYSVVEGVASREAKL